MKLDRNIPENSGLGKYALILLRPLHEQSGNVSTFERWTPEVSSALGVLDSLRSLDWGNTDDSEFFVIRLKDKHAATALSAYARSAEDGGDLEYAAEIRALATKAAQHPNKKTPD